MKKIRIVTASRKSQSEFINSSPLGRSLNVYRGIAPLQLVLYPENQRSLSAIYNEAIEVSRDDPAILVFMHDDVYLNDFFWMDRIANGLDVFDIVGLAGNTRRLPRQPSWIHINEKLFTDTFEHLSGAIGHGSGFPCPVSFYGPAGLECEILDGVLLAVDSKTLHRTNLRFDDRFHFHFYDMDFCRQARTSGLRLGTWPLSIIHESSGLFESAEWKEAYDVYLKKYGD